MTVTAGDGHLLLQWSRTRSLRGVLGFALGPDLLDPVAEPPDNNIKENIDYDDYADMLGCGRPKARACDPNYHKAPSHLGVDNRRVVLIPLVKVSEYDPGRDTVKFFRFGAFFLKTKASGGSGGAMQAEYIEDRLAIGEGGYDPTAAAGDPTLAAPVLYR